MAHTVGTELALFGCFATASLSISHPIHKQDDWIMTWGCQHMLIQVLPRGVRTRRLRVVGSPITICSNAMHRQETAGMGSIGSVPCTGWPWDNIYPCMQ